MIRSKVKKVIKVIRIVSNKVMVVYLGHTKSSKNAIGNFINQLILKSFSYE